MFHHLLELRKRLLRATIVIALVFSILAFFSNFLYQSLAWPLVQHVAPESVRHALIATSIMAPVLVPLKCAFIAALMVTMPYLLAELWYFIAPALYRHEKRWMWPLLVSSSFLFYLGVLFAYYVVVPLVFAFVLSIAPTGVEVKPDISLYLGFMLRMFVAFGLSFELPVAIVLLVFAGVVNVATLGKKRPYVIVGLLVVSMFLTPPDVFSQILLALPMWVLFELGLLIARRVERTKLASASLSR